MDHVGKKKKLKTILKPETCFLALSLAFLLFFGSKRSVSCQTSTIRDTMFTLTCIISAIAGSSLSGSESLTESSLLTSDMFPSESSELKPLSLLSLLTCLLVSFADDGAFFFFREMAAREGEADGMLALGEGDWDGYCLGEDRDGLGDETLALLFC